MTKKFYSVESENFSGNYNYESEYFESLEEAKKYAMSLNPISGGTHTVTEYEIEDNEEIDDMIGEVDGEVVFETKPIMTFKNMSEEEFADYLLSLKDSITYGLMGYDLTYWFDLNGTNYKIYFVDDDIDEYLESLGKSTEDVDYEKLIEAEEKELLKFLFKEHKEEIIKEIEKFGDK